MVEDPLLRSRGERAPVSFSRSAQSVARAAAAPVDIAWLAALRVLFGLVMSAAALRFLAKGWVGELLVAPPFHFTYAAFWFVRPLPEPLLTALYGLLALCSLGVAIGFYYRACAVVVFLGFTYVELVDKAIYLNHYYLVSLLAGLLVLLPAGRAYSVDASRKPALLVSSVPSWVLYALRLQVGVVYFFAGAAKLNADWLLDAQPLRIWLAARADSFPFAAALGSPVSAYVASWLGAAFDLSIVFFLLNARTRKSAFTALVVFHALTGLLFPIGIFPWLMTAAATVFLAPSWARGSLERGLALVDLGPARTSQAPRAWLAPHWLGAVLLLHSALQVLLPLRRFLEPSNSAWTQRGFNFGWNVMVAEKAGQVGFRVRDRRSGIVERVEPSSWLAHFQEVAMAQDPEMVRQGALFLAEKYRVRGRDVQVFADAVASLNGRPSRPLIDPTVDLTGPLPATWILPLD